MSFTSKKIDALVSRILTFSCVDGPGNRMVIFLQGCNFTCISCHNPHTINHCNHCGDCVSHCPAQALTINSQRKVIWDEDKCTGCDKCIDACSHQSNPKIVRYRVEQLIEKIRSHHFFLSGITVSGGEATLQLPFIIALFKAIKNDAELAHLSCFIDSNGSLATEGWTRIMPYLDGAMIDLKAWQSQTHLWLVGRDKHRVIESINLLGKHGKLHEVRLLHIPDKSDLASEVLAVGEYLKALPEQVKIRINAFQHHGVTGEALTWEKCSRIQIEHFHDALYQQIQRPILMPTHYR